jgi:hypothetical protein
MASTITVTLPEFDGSYYNDVDYPLAAVEVGTFNYLLPAGEDIVSATLEGTWGNSNSGSTAHNKLYLDGVQVANTYDASPNPYYNTVPWSYSFSDFSLLEDGSATLEAVQWSEYSSG